MGPAVDTLTATPARAVVFSGLVEACDNSDVSYAGVSWLLYERACHLSLTLSSRAQAVLWKQQSGDLCMTECITAAASLIGKATWMLACI